MSDHNPPDKGLSAHLPPPDAEEIAKRHAAPDTTPRPVAMTKTHDAQAQVHSAIGRGTTPPFIQAPPAMVTKDLLDYLMGYWETEWSGEEITWRHVLLMLFDLGIIGGMTPQDMKEAMDVTTAAPADARPRR